MAAIKCDGSPNKWTLRNISLLEKKIPKIVLLVVLLVVVPGTSTTTTSIVVVLVVASRERERDVLLCNALQF
jgi:hypothetical protein